MIEPSCVSSTKHTKPYIILPMCTIHKDLNYAHTHQKKFIKVMNLKKEASELWRIKDLDFSLLLMCTGKHFSSAGRTQNFKSNHQGNSLQGLQVHPGLSYMKTAHVIKIKKEQNNETVCLLALHHTHHILMAVNNLSDCQ